MSPDPTVATAVAAHTHTGYRLLTTVTGADASRQLKSCYDAGKDVALFLADQQVAELSGITF